MSLMSEILDISSWTPRHYIIFSIGLVSINLLGPRGWVHHYYIKQEIKLTDDKILKEKALIAEKEENLLRLKKSTRLKERLLREELGLLKDDEWSLELYTNESGKTPQLFLASSSAPLNAQKKPTTPKRR